MTLKEYDFSRYGSDNLKGQLRSQAVEFINIEGAVRDLFIFNNACKAGQLPVLLPMRLGRSNALPVLIRIASARPAGFHHKGLDASGAYEKRCVA